MCGICGISNFKNDKSIDENILKEMTMILKHRGPDDEGYYIGKINDLPKIGLGIRRLSIIDLETGYQPIHNENKTIWIVFNGEIYNFLDLRKELENKHTFYTNTDTETIVHLYEDYDEDCVKYLRGMFAFAIWDAQKKKLFLARDRIGKKPLYYTIIDGSLIFASEIKSILLHPKVKKNINLRAIHLYLTYQYIPSPQTIFEKIYRLPPASTLTSYFKKEIKIKKYWDLDFTKKTKLNFYEASQHLKEILTEATRIRLFSDVPLGAFLSGGHDSSIVVGLMSKFSTKKVKTFSIGFEEQDFSELKYARIVAKHFDTEHHEFIVKPQFIEILPKIIWHYDQPFADSSALPTYFVSMIARPYITVALNGDGGDENFAGYLRYKAMKCSSLLSLPFQLFGKKIVQLLDIFFPRITSYSNIFRYAYRLSSGLSEPPSRRNILWHCYFDNELKKSIYSKEMLQRFKKDDAYEYMNNVFLNSPASNIMDKTFYTDIKTYLPECLLVKMDIASMANSLEARAPLLDHKLFEFTASLPPEWKLHGFTTKYILRKTFEDFLPKEILHRRKKGFGIPVNEWFRTSWKDYFCEIVFSSTALKRGYFNKNGLERIFNEHIKGFRNHGYRLWALLVLELWHRIFIDGENKKWSW